jgi:hypothetical protein
LPNIPPYPYSPSRQGSFLWIAPNSPAWAPTLCCYNGLVNIGFVLSRPSQKKTRERKKG